MLAENARERCKVMGIVNVTEDSFSDGGLYKTFDAAIAHAHELAAEGADILDIGGESTRPGAHRVSEEEEISRVVPVVRELAKEGHLVSVDTMRASVAEAAIAEGAVFINDVSGGLADPNMYRVCADGEVPICLMHWKTDRFGSASGRAETHPDGIVADVRKHLLRLVDDALAAGIVEENIVLDPGLGFAKNADDNWALLHGLPELIDLGFPVLVGASRKRFAAAIGGEARAPKEADAATAAISTLSAAAGAWAVRVHNVADNLDAVRVAQAWGLGRSLTGYSAAGDYPEGGGNRAADNSGNSGNVAADSATTTTERA
ncbi:MAG: dihydropteroate synthase [Corynebacterium sp.]|uniref:dihydropteroate synthase n=1 Tax=Corynebacterium sp. TaxID=1720 RepID=UPI0026DC9925|nr:dihydropteroate synthase [Corynebacterium sp.]MDO5030584.1 dihydropteroate synthase [Corynebacterium sp.]